MNPSNAWSSLRRAASWHRRSLAALCAAGCVLATLSVLSPTTRTVDVVVAAHDLTAGTTLTAADLALARYPPELVPEGALSTLSEAQSATSTLPITHGTPLTPAMVGGTGSMAAPGERLAAFRLSDAGLRALMSVGDRVTVVATTDEGDVTTLATRVRVVALPAERQASGALSSPSDGGLVVVSCAPSVAERIAAWSNSSRLGVALG